jgi:hypothetical protein
VKSRSTDPQQDLKAWLVENLSSKDKARRKRAEEKLDSLGPAAFDIVLDLLRDEAHKRRRAKRGLYWGMGIYLGIIGVVVLAWVAHGLITQRWGKFPEVFQFFTFFSFFGAAAAASAAQKTGTRWLARYHDPGHIGAFLDALGTANDKETTEAARMPIPISAR